MKKNIFSIANRIIFKYILLSAIILVCSCRASGKAVTISSQLATKYSKWLDLPTNQLVNKGREYLYQRNSPDSALVCFSIAASRYNESLPKEEKEDIFKAFIGRWYAQFFHYYDYPKAYENLIEALKISNDLGKGRGMANLNLAMMYQMFGTDGRDKSALTNARNYNLKAFSDALAEKDTNVVHMAFSNMVSLVEDNAGLRELGKYKKEYVKFAGSSPNPVSGFNTLLYDINLAVSEKNYDKALKLLEKQRDFISPVQPRYEISNLMSKANVNRMKGNYTEAEELLKQAEEIASQGGMKDVLLNIYDERKGIFHDSGNPSKEAEAYHAYLCMKDTLLNYRQISGFSEINFLSEIETLDRSLAETQYKRKVQTWIVVFCLIVIISLIWLVLVILKKNRKLRSANLSLYEKNKEKMDMEVENERLITGESNSQSKDQAENSLSQADKEKRDSLMARIYAVATSSEEIFSPKFTISKFAELAGIPVKQVSQLINESAGDNFNGFINHYRIKRACHMLDDIETYGSLTIENIGLSVGFRSRTAFIAAFKKFTGLNPSDYLKAAKQARLNLKIS